jgi:hypothetical protein
MKISETAFGKLQDEIRKIQTDSGLSDEMMDKIIPGFTDQAFASMPEPTTGQGIYDIATGDTESEDRDAIVSAINTLMSEDPDAAEDLMGLTAEQLQKAYDYGQKLDGDEVLQELVGADEPGAFVTSKDITDNIDKYGKTVDAIREFSGDVPELAAALEDSNEDILQMIKDGDFDSKLFNPDGTINEDGLADINQSYIEFQEWVEAGKELEDIVKGGETQDSLQAAIDFMFGTPKSIENLNELIAQRRLEARLRPGDKKLQKKLATLKELFGSDYRITKDDVPELTEWLRGKLGTDKSIEDMFGDAGPTDYEADSPAVFGESNTFTETLLEKLDGGPGFSMQYLYDIEQTDPEFVKNLFKIDGYKNIAPPEKSYRSYAKRVAATEQALKAEKTLKPIRKTLPKAYKAEYKHAADGKNSLSYISSDNYNAYKAALDVLIIKRDSGIKGLDHEIKKLNTIIKSAQRGQRWAIKEYKEYDEAWKEWGKKEPKGITGDPHRNLAWREWNEEFERLKAHRDGWYDKIRRKGG